MTNKSGCSVTKWNLDFLAPALPSMSEGWSLPFPLSSGTLLRGSEAKILETSGYGRRPKEKEGKTERRRGQRRGEREPQRQRRQICWPLCFPGGLVGRDPLASAGDTGDMGLISGSGRSLEVGSGNLLQCSHLENSRDRVTWWAAVQGVAKSWTQLSTHMLCLSSLPGALRVFHGDFPTFILSV